MLGQTHVRRCVFVDNMALWDVLCQMFDEGHTIDYRKLKLKLTGISTVPLRIYCKKQRKAFHAMLRAAGYMVILVDDISSELLIDMAGMVTEGSHFTLVSGSTSYVKGVQRLSECGIGVEVAFFREHCSDELLSAASSFRHLNPDDLVRKPQGRVQTDDFRIRQSV